MITKNKTPLLLGTKVTSRRPPRPEMTVIAKGVLRLRPGEPLTFLRIPDASPLTSDVFADGDDERLGECLYPSDFADFKLNAEVMLRGTCHTPGGRPMTETGVRFSVGAWSKSLRVMGPRVWTDRVGRPISNPQPFTKMPITYANAFGGATYPLNPAGTGLDTPRLPSVEHTSEIVRSRSDRPAPASFGPLNPGWPQRAGKVGKAYGRSYVKERSPYYAEDFDWRYFSAAPPDQQLKGYLRGDEEIAFHGLSPDAAVFSARLPAIRVRAFVKDDAGRFREVTMVLDTLFADLDEGELSLLWRGVEPVRESDLADVKTVLLATEPLADPPGPLASYEQALEAFEQDPAGIEAAKQKMLALHEVPGGAALGVALGAPGASREELIQGLVGATLGPTPEAAGLAAQASSGEAEEQPPIPTTSKPGGMPSIGLRRTMRDRMSRLRPMLKAVERADLSPDEREKIARVNALPLDPRWVDVDPEYTPPEPLSTDEPGPGKNLVDRDFTGRDLSGVDLSGANLDGAVLVRANLRGARLAGASLRGALLFKADLTGADLTKANLRRVNAAKVYAERADLTGAFVEQAFFEDAVLTGAILNGIVGEHAVFTRADLLRASLKEAVLRRAGFEEARIEEADFTRAYLVGGNFDGCRGRKAVLRGAQIKLASFVKADLAGARFLEASGERVYFHLAILDGADFGWAVLPASHFTEASAARVRFRGADLRDCRFYRARLDDADMSASNLFNAELNKAKLSRVKFVDANLYDAKFLEAAGAGCDFTGANLKRSTLEGR